MIFNITEDWRVETDSFNFTLQRRRVVRDKKSKNFGQESWGENKYYGSMRLLLAALAERGIRESSELAEIHGHLERVLAVINEETLSGFMKTITQHEEHIASLKGENLRLREKIAEQGQEHPEKQ
jgi:hypothetical protein